MRLHAAQLSAKDVSAKSLTGKEFADMSHADRADVLKSMRPGVSFDGGSPFQLCQ